MKVRDLKQYIEILTQSSNAVPTLGGGDDLLLKEYYGRVENLDQTIADLANFATDARNQIFYELMQNAEDAEAESLHFLFNERGLVVLNNGLPFYTDATDKEGQLFEFLFKGKGRKSDKPNKIGEHGQGSKLLYTLMLPNEYLDRKEAVRKHILQDLKGPILFSWQRESDITQLFTWCDEPFDYTGNCENLHYPLLTKIVMTYYPARLAEVATLYDGRMQALFPKDELIYLIQFMKEIRFKVSWTDFHRGTLLYIPLGEGQEEKLGSTWGNALQKGISVSMDFLQHLKYVYVNGEQIRRSGLHVIQLGNLTTGENSIPLQIAMSKVGERLDAEVINFYKYFPIARAVYGLNYLINTKAYDVGAARQDIDITNDNNKHLLIEISAKIGKYIQQLRENGNQVELIQFLRCVLGNKPYSNIFFKEHFHDNLLKVFAANLPTKSGFADSPATVRIKKTGLLIRPEDLGVEGWDWLDESLSDVYDSVEAQLVVLSYTSTDLVEEAAENEQFKLWIFGLPDAQYLQLLEEIQTEIKDPDRIQNLRCWRFSNREVYTFKEITTDDTLILLLPEIKPLVQFLGKTQAPLGGWELDKLSSLNQVLKLCETNLLTFMWNRTTTQLSTLENLIRDDKWAIFKIYHNNPTSQQYIGKHLTIFVNTKGEKKALGELSDQTTNWAPSGILDMLTIRASEVIPEIQSYFIKKEEIWPYLVDNWSLVEAHLSSDFSTYRNKLVDLNDIQSANKPSQLLNDNKPWVLLPSGELAAPGKVFAQEALSSLNAGQYIRLSEFIASNTDLKMVDSNLVSEILAITFAPLPQSGLSALKSALSENGTKIDRETLELFPKIGSHLEGVFRYFTILKLDNSVDYVLKKNEKSCVQYFTQDEELIEFLRHQEGYYLIPRELLKIFQDDKTLKNEIIDNDFILYLIEKFGAQRAFIDIVSNKSNVIVKERFLEKTMSINLSSDIEPANYRGMFEFKVIKMLASHDHWIAEYKNKIQIDGINISDFNFADEVKIGDTEKEYSFSLARLLPVEYGDLGKKLSIVKSKMEGSGFSKLIKVDKYDPLKIVPKINVPHAYHLTFLLAFYHYKTESQTSWDINSISWDNVNKEDALQEFYERKMTFFSDFDFPEGWFNIRTAFATKEPGLLLEQEIIYPWILEWMNQGDDASQRKQFLIGTRLKDESDPSIKMRRKFRNKESFHEKELDEVFSSSIEMLEAMLSWIINCFDSIELNSSRDISLRKILDYYWTDHNRLPEVVPIINSGIGANKMHLIFKSPDWNKVRYISSLAEEEGHLWHDVIEREDYEFLYTPDSIGNKFREGLSSKMSIPEARLVKSIAIPANEPKPWEERVYQAWKAEESVDLSIFLLDCPVPFIYNFETSNVSIPIHSRDNVKADRDKDNIYIHQEFPNEDIYKILSDYQGVLFKRDPDKLVRLLAKKLAASSDDDSLLTDDQKDKIRNNPESYRRIIDLSEEDIQILSDNADKIMPLVRDVNIEELHRLIQETDENTRSQILEHLDLVKTISDMGLSNVLGQLLKIADKEQLGKLVEMWDEIEQELEREKSSPKPVALIGYIGERLVYLWLKSNKRNIEDVDHVGLDRLPYDVLFKYKNSPFKIEVKTTIKSIKEQDETIPFFLRASQYEYIQNHPNEEYIVVRLSLSDLGLSDLYENYKVLGADLDDILGEYANQIDDELKKYLNSSTSNERFKKTRMVFKMNIPKFDQEFWED